MRLALAATFALTNAWFATATPRPEPLPIGDASKRGLPVSDVCQTIKLQVSDSSVVSFPGSIQYKKDIYHQSASSTELAACSAQPGTAQDIATILKIVGDNKTPFAVKGGGHAMNVGFSSTTGVHIAMSRFKQVEYNAQRQEVVIGAGQIWDDVYATLDPLNVTVAGGRASGVGVAGFILGGGYSFLSNQHGLTVDTVVAYELVLANGTIRTVTAADSDLFWALKGGGNNLGVVTKFTLKAFPYTQVWGGLVTNVLTLDRDDAIEAIMDFEKNVKDPKAAVLPSFIIVDGIPIIATILFYFGPTKPPGIFDKFLNLPNPLGEVPLLGGILGSIPITRFKDVKTRKMKSLLDSTPFLPTKDQRGAFHTVSVPANTRDLLKAAVEENVNAAVHLLPVTGLFVGYHIEPFVAGFLNNPNRTSESAFPPTRDTGLPLNIFYSWGLQASDNIMVKALKDSTRKLEATIPQPLLPRYPNYCLADTPLSEMFGSNIERMRAIAQSVDPAKTMSLAGGFKV